MKSAIYSSFSRLSLGAIYLLALLNPVLKKYDYGAGYPIVILLACVLTIIAFLEWKKERETAKLEKISLLVFCSALFASFVMSSTKTVGFSEVMAFSTMISFYLLFAYQKFDWGGWMLRVICGGALLAVFVGYCTYFLWPEPRMAGSFFSTLYHAHHWPNAFALFLLMVWPIFLIVDFFKKRRFLQVVLMGLVLSALLLTFSRGALIAFAGQVVLMAVLFWKELNWKKIASASLVALIAAGLFVGANQLRSSKYDVIDLEEKVKFENQESLTSGQERMDFWKGSVELALNKPLFGHGPFSFRYAYNPLQKELLATSDHPHNFFLKIWSENGSVAIAALMIFLLSLLVTVYERFEGLSKEKKLIVRVLLVAVAGSLAHSMIDYNFNFLANLFLLFFYLALIRSTVIVKTQQKHRNITAVWLSLIIGIIALVEGLLLVGAEIGTDDELRFSLYPRNYYLNAADSAMQEGEYNLALEKLDLEIALNPLSDRAYFLKSAIFCSDTQNFYDLDLCRLNIAQAIALNPLNDIDYHKQYLLAHGTAMSEEALMEMKNLLLHYMDFVSLNVHFTAYTNNVEAAAGLVKLLESYIGPADYLELELRAEQMTKEAEIIRAEKKF